MNERGEGEEGERCDLEPGGSFHLRISRSTGWSVREGPHANVSIMDRPRPGDSLEGCRQYGLEIKRHGHTCEEGWQCLLQISKLLGREKGNRTRSCAYANHGMHELT